MMAHYHKTNDRRHRMRTALEKAWQELADAEEEIEQLKATLSTLKARAVLRR